MENLDSKAVFQLSITKPATSSDCGPLALSMNIGSSDCNSGGYSSFLSLEEKRNAVLPGYKLLPVLTNLNSPPPIEGKFLPGDVSHKVNQLGQIFPDKCESLAISGLAGYGDEIDVIAPADVLKQIFKTPYSNSALSVTVRRIGRTLVLNHSSDLQVRNVKGRKKSGGVKELFAKFVQHSVLGSQSSHQDDQQEDLRERCPNVVFGTETGVVSSSPSADGESRQTVAQLTGTYSSRGGNDEEESYGFGNTSNSKMESGFLSSRKSVQENGKDTASGESIREPCDPQTDSEFELPVRDGFQCEAASEESRKDGGLEGFLRILFWRFDHVHMLLGSDLLLFSNKKHLAVSLHLISTTRESDPMKWLDIWLDNVMASVPEAAICYHLNGVVQGYELLDTDDILSIKGLAGDGTPFMNPQVIQKNASSVLQFLMKKCSKDPGIYLLQRAAGEDHLQLFDLTPSSSSSKPSSETADVGASHKDHENGLFLSMLLYRVANRLYQENDERSYEKCARLYTQCLEILGEDNHPGVRASAHENMGRLLLEFFSGLSFSGKEKLLVAANVPTANPLLSQPTEIEQEVGTAAAIEADLDTTNAQTLIVTKGTEEGPDLSKSLEPDSVESLCVGESGQLLAVAAQRNDISANLQAVHHISEAIRSLRIQRQLLESGEEYLREIGLVTSKKDQNRLRGSYSDEAGLCICGEAGCLPLDRIAQGHSQGDSKLLQLILLLGEAYLSLAMAFKQGNQLGKALRSTELACLVCGSFNRPLFSSARMDPTRQTESSFETSGPDAPGLDFWGRLWCFVGDIYLQFYQLFEQAEFAVQQEISSSEEVLLSGDVAREVKRLRKKRGKNLESCSVCSEISCSCLSDRCSSGSSASSSAGGSTRLLRVTEKAGEEKHAQNIIQLKVGPMAKSGIKEKRKEKTAQKKLSKQKQIKAGSNKSSAKSTHTKPPQNIETQGKQSNAPGSGEKSALRDESKQLLCFGRLISSNWEANLKAASEHYAAAAVCFSDLKACADYCNNGSGKELPTADEKWLDAVKKRGWSLNEIGRRYLIHGSFTQAEEWLVKARDSFTEANDSVNVVLVCCNLGHGKRAIAEKFAGNVPPCPPILTDEMIGLRRNKSEPALSKAESAKPSTGLPKLFSVARKLYHEALEFYSTACKVVSKKGKSESMEETLWIDAHTQFGNTHLRLAMLESNEMVHRKLFWSDSAFLHELSAKDSFMSAISLYESLGECRIQESAFAHHQMALYHRNNVMLLVKEIMESGVSDPSMWQQAKRFVALAEVHWEKALAVYRPDSHSDMFVSIWMERSLLCLAVSSQSRSNKSLEAALGMLLESRRVWQAKKTLGEVKIFLSPETKAKLVSRIQQILHELLANLMPLRAKQSLDQHESESPHEKNWRRLKELYRLSLCDPLDVDELYQSYVKN